MRTGSDLVVKRQLVKVIKYGSPGLPSSSFLCGGAPRTPGWEGVVMSQRKRRPKRRVQPRLIELQLWPALLTAAAACCMPWWGQQHRQGTCRCLTAVGLLRWRPAPVTAGAGRVSGAVPREAARAGVSWGSRTGLGDCPSSAGVASGRWLDLGRPLNGQSVREASGSPLTATSTVRPNEPNARHRTEWCEFQPVMLLSALGMNAKIPGRS